MNPVLWHRGTTVGGKFTPHDIGAFRATFAALGGLETEVAARKYHRNRTNRQNRYLFGVVYAIISESTGYTPEEVHELFKVMFLSRRRTMKPKAKKKGRKRKPVKVLIVKSTASLTTVQFEEYIEKIRRFAATKMDLVIPDPNQATV